MIKDSGTRRSFAPDANGDYAVRDCAEGKGRFDLVPLDTIAELYDDEFLDAMALEHFEKAFWYAVNAFYDSKYSALLDLAKHFENGAKKYKPNNWRTGAGIPKESYIDSACRHYAKAKAGWKDEPHEIACIWNLVCLIYSIDKIYDEPIANGECKNCEYYCTGKKSEWYLKCVLDNCAGRGENGENWLD